MSSGFGFGSEPRRTHACLTSGAQKVRPGSLQVLFYKMPANYRGTVASARENRAGAVITNFVLVVISSIISGYSEDQLLGVSDLLSIRVKLVLSCSSEYIAIIRLLPTVLFLFGNARVGRHLAVSECTKQIPSVAAKESCTVKYTTLRMLARSGSPRQLLNAPHV
jgi:hypothetical protein